MEKLTRLIMAVFLLAAGCTGPFQSTGVIFAGAVSFSDTAGHWAESSIMNAVTKGYVEGYEDGTFRPDQSISRAEFLKMAVSGLNISPSGSGDAWYSGYVRAAVESGFHRYEDFSTGTMDSPITREEMARIVSRAADAVLQKELDSRKLVYEAVKKGLIQGLTGGELGLDESTTRAQSVTVIERILTAKSGGTLPVDKAASSFAELNLRNSNVETMWGNAAVAFPRKVDFGNSVDFTIHKLVVLDWDNPLPGFEEVKEELMRGDGKSIENNYLVGMYITAKNTKIQDDGHFAIPSALIGAWQYVNARVKREYREKSKFKELKVLDFRKLDEDTAWHFLAVNKSIVDPMLKDNELIPIAMANLITKQKIYMELER